MSATTCKQVEITFPNGKCCLLTQGVLLSEVVKQQVDTARATIVAAKMDELVTDLCTPVTKNCRICWIDMTTEEGVRIYQRSLSLVLIRAVKELYPGSDATIEHSLNKGLYCEVKMARSLEPTDVENIRQRMAEIIAGNDPIEKIRMPRAEAIAFFERNNQLKKANLFRDNRRPIVTIYRCGWLADYFYGCMVPSTGYLRCFDVQLYADGLILRCPDVYHPACLPPWHIQPKLTAVFREAERWGKILECGYVADLNHIINTGCYHELVRVAEALHEKKIAQIADQIVEQQRRIILIAGPSSSGKTTFAQRLMIQLRVNGLRPVAISLDDYFVDREYTPRDENGEYDFEALDAIDIPLFNRHLLALLNGEKISMPTFNFLAGKRASTNRTLMVENNQPLIIEGIHGLNERLTADIPAQNKFTIYVSAITQINIDSHNRIPTTDTRLLRRIVRDSQFRAHDAQRTIQQWPSVRRGEERNIFPFQEQADAMFNSALIYEFSILKRIAEPLLYKVPRHSADYSEAARLLHFLSMFQPVHTSEVPANSILREFIGDSCFVES